MPKLQHIRVAGKFFVGFEIPESMTHLWSYIREMYQLDAFTQSCPADQVHMHLKCLFVCRLLSQHTVHLVRATPCRDGKTQSSKEVLTNLAFSLFTQDIIQIYHKMQQQLHSWLTAFLF